jgi:hypothetical protein
MTHVSLRFFKGGGVRAVHNDDYQVPTGAVPRRASHVEPIQSGPHAGMWFVDMSPLGEEYEYSLWPPYPKRREALEAEVKHLEEFWVCGT